ncbi:hypothetical protein C1H46_025065 [Malus baccata]|uniref:Uncharacterized protein n=1 Tax=Malus baccata TaxID=106549 RepID=A0A540LT29_MALBA|nr:hypothetical protein C1H46_025065 [Malus baccata]
MKLHAEKKRSRSLGTSSSSRIQDGWDNVVLLTDDYDEFRSIIRCPLPRSVSPQPLICNDTTVTTRRLGLPTRLLHGTRWFTRRLWSGVDGWV